MSAQSTIHQPMSGGVHVGPLWATIAIAAAIAGLGLAIALLSSMTPAQTTTPAFDAPAFRAGERNLVISPAFDAPAFRAEEKVLLAGSALSTASSFVGDQGMAPRALGPRVAGSTFAGDRGIAPRTSGN